MQYGGISDKTGKLKGAWKRITYICLKDSFI